MCCSHEPLMRGFDDLFCAPHSRHTEVRADDIRKHSELRLLAESHEAGVLPSQRPSTAGRFSCSVTANTTRTH